MTRGAGINFTHGHPLVRVLVDEMRARGITVLQLEDRSGIGHASLYNWCHKGHYPNLRSLEACLNTVGFDLTVTRR